MKQFLINPDTSIKETLKRIHKAGQKCLVVVDNNNFLLGTLSDGDVRKAIIKEEDLNSSINKYYNPNSTYLQDGAFNPERAKDIFITNRYDLIPIVDSESKVVKVLLWADIFEYKQTPNKELKVPVVIMAGGKGTRLEPFTDVLPKPLLPVNNKTIIEHIITEFTNIGIDEFYMSVNYKSKILKAFFQELNPNYNVSFIEEDKPLGTAGSLSLLPSRIDIPFFMTNCDIIIKADYNDLYSFHIKNQYDITLVASAKEYVIPYGTCKLNSEGSLSSIDEKPVFDFLVNTGLYVINPDMIDLIPKDSFFDFPELLEMSRNMDKKIGVYPIGEQDWTDVGQWSEYKEAIGRF